MSDNANAFPASEVEDALGAVRDAIRTLVHLQVALGNLQRAREGAAETVTARAIGTPTESIPLGPSLTYSAGGAGTSGDESPPGRRLDYQAFGDRAY